MVVLDEAHNIEDSARDATSGSFDLEAVTACLMECEKMVEAKVLTEVHSGLASFVSRLGIWMQRAAADATDYTDFESSTKVWGGTQARMNINTLA